MAEYDGRANQHKLLGKLDADESTPLKRVRELLAPDAGVLTIVGDVQTTGGGTVTVEFFFDSDGTLGGPDLTETMDASTGYVKHIVCTPDVYIKLTMSSRDTDDIDFYAG